MRYVAMVLLLMAAGACGTSEIRQSQTAYKACLENNPPERCASEKARLDADIAVKDMESRRRASVPPIPPPLYLPQQPMSYGYRQPISCQTYGSVTNCY